MRLLIVALLAALAATPAVARAEVVPSPCATPIPVTPALVRVAFDLQSFARRNGGLIAGQLEFTREPAEEAEAASGTVVFAKRDGVWRAVMPQNFQSGLAYFSGPGGRLVIITQRLVEGPDQAFTFVRTDDAFSTATCAPLPFPAALNNPDWNNETLRPEAFNLAADGRGELIASAALNRSGEAPRMLWFSYATDDGGKTWRPAEEISGSRKLRGQWRTARRIPTPTRSAELMRAALAQQSALSAGRT
jgi:hypothetical protein